MNVSAEQIAAVYDFESVLERTLQTLFNNELITSFTCQDFGAMKDDGKGNQVPVIDFQKDRPRVEILFTAGAGQGQFRPLTVDGVEVPVETSFKGQYRLDIVTAADIKIHAAYRTLIRYLLHTQLLSVNGVDPMTLHRIHRFQMDAGTSPTYKPDEGTLRTILTFDIDFSIQDDAWLTVVPPVPAEPDITPVPVETRTIDDTDGNPLVDTEGNELTGF